MLGPTMAPQLWPSRATDQQIVGQELGQCLAMKKSRQFALAQKIALHTEKDRCIVQCCIAWVVQQLHCSKQTHHSIALRIASQCGQRMSYSLISIVQLKLEDMIWQCWECWGEADLQWQPMILTCSLIWQPHMVGIKNKDMLIYPRDTIQRHSQGV